MACVLATASVHVSEGDEPMPTFPPFGLAESAFPVTDTPPPRPTEQSEISREESLQRQIEGLLREAKALQEQGRLEEARQHREKAAYRASQLADWLRQPVAEPPFSDNAIVNGSFEMSSDGSPPEDCLALQPGDSRLAGWHIRDPRPAPQETDDIQADFARQPLCVDWIGPRRWKASHGAHCLDLDGGIEQTIATAVGTTYVLRFDMAGNPETGDVTRQTLLVKLNDQASKFMFDSTGSSAADLKWATHHVVFAAREANTRIGFINADPNSYSAGVALDHVSIHPLDEGTAAQVKELYQRVLRFDDEAAALRAAGRAEEGQQHADAAERYRAQIKELLEGSRAVPTAPVP
ncbi:MAG: DUF642 domain-containing protein [Pirellulales bacterium]